MSKPVVFVFGSNLAGIHGRGSAKEAKLKWGAQLGVGEGPTGRAYAIPTKDKYLRKRTRIEIKASIRTFLSYARTHMEMDFHVVDVGCGAAGYMPHEIAPLFRGTIPSNVHFLGELKELLR